MTQLTQDQIAAIMFRQDRPLIADIIADTSAKTGISVDDICGYSRKREIVRARHLAMWSLRQEGLTLEAIGSAIGGRDHTTVAHGIKQIDAILKTTQ